MVKPSSSINAKDTEKRILETAKRVFLQKGLDGARMQDIANEAGVNKALVHYYFRSKENLYKIVVQDVFDNLFPEIFDIMAQEMSLNEKVYSFFDVYLSFLAEHPELPHFIVTEVVRQPRLISEMFYLPRELGILDKIQIALDESVLKGEIKPITATDFLVNLISLSVFPIIGRPILQSVFNQSEKQFDSYLEDRKLSAAKFFLNAIS